MPFLSEPEDRPYDWATADEFAVHCEIDESPRIPPIDPFVESGYRDFLGGVRDGVSWLFGRIRDGLLWLFYLACELFVPAMIVIGFIAFVMSVYSLGFTEGEKTENILCTQGAQGGYECIPVADETIEAIENGLGRG